FQGGGALGAYQVGVYRALHEAGVDPDWVIGTSIGAINGVLIAGTSHGQRLERLRTFWRRIEPGALREQLSAWPGFGPMTVHWSTIMQGVAGFFT
ncbi:patatin-like phospholipase family protein, partial [Acinetobacter baumannii]